MILLIFVIAWVLSWGDPLVLTSVLAVPIGWLVLTTRVRVRLSRKPVTQFALWPAPNSQEALTVRFVNATCLPGWEFEEVADFEADLEDLLRKQIDQLTNRKDDHLAVAMQTYGLPQWDAPYLKHQRTLAQIRACSPEICRYGRLTGALRCPHCEDIFARHHTGLASAHTVVFNDVLAGMDTDGEIR